MVYVKSVLAGLLAAVAVTIVLPILVIIGIVLYSAIHPPPEGMSVGWDPISLVHRPPLPIVAFIVLVFASGFFREFRRLTRR